jgi:uncharacterized protein YdaT
MPWTKKNFPGAMKNLSAGVRSKAIEIGNAMLEGPEYQTESGRFQTDRDVIIAEAIIRARDWAAENGKRVYRNRKLRPGGTKRILT